MAGSQRKSQQVRGGWMLIVACLAVMAGGLAGCMPTGQLGTAAGWYGAGIAVEEPFLSFYRAAGGAEVLGDPLCEQRLEQGLLVQYLANARLEWNPQVCRVCLSPAGVMLGYREPAVQPSPVAREHPEQFRYYQQTGHTLAPAFAAYYDAFGGPELLGFPISEAQLREGLTVQCFERALLEYHPGAPEGQQVRLSALGRRLKDKQDQALSVAQAGQVSAAAAPTPDATRPLTVLTAARYQVTSQGGYQVVEVTVLDDAGRGVSGVPIRIVIHDRQADRSVVAEPTDGAGHTRCAFPIGDSPQGYAVVVDIVAAYGAQELTTQTSYVAWTPSS